MSPTFSYGSKGKLYRYYVSAQLQQGQRRRKDETAIRRVPTAALEARLAEMIRRLAASQASDPLALIARAEIHQNSVQLLMPVRLLPMIRSRLEDGEHVERDHEDGSKLRLCLPIRMKFRGGRTAIAGGQTPAAKPDPVLIKALRTAHDMIEHDPSGLPLLHAAPDSPYRRRLVRLAFLAPDLQREILAGRQPRDLTLCNLLQGRLPLLWAEQVAVLRSPMR